MRPAQATYLADALATGYAILAQGGPALIAVESTISLLEQSGLFNAGRGANRQLDGVQRMDAAIMEGAYLKAGAVASIEKTIHPITAAKFVMEKTAHVLLVGPPATWFAQHGRVEQLPRGQSPGRSLGRSLRASTTATQTMRLYRAMLKSRQAQKDRHGTVGAVALDRSGTVAAGSIDWRHRFDVARAGW
jgi:L-asparaginase / beta-aspartyl-peptidase